MSSGARTRKTTKWAAWASRIASRFYRRPGTLHLAVVLHQRNSRASVVIENRWLHAFHFHPQFYWSIAMSRFLRADQIFAKQMNLLTPVGVAGRAGPRREPALLEVAGQGAPVEKTRVLTKVDRNARREFASLLERRFVEKRDGHATRTAERLALRSNRIERFSFNERTMTLRGDSASVVSPAAKSVLSTASASTGMRQTSSHSEPRPPAAPAINVDQLAEQVIRQIDRRVIARRERIGRI